jgi:hypothetical protein
MAKTLGAPLIRQDGDGHAMATFTWCDGENARVLRFCFVSHEARDPPGTLISRVVCVYDQHGANKVWRVRAWLPHVAKVDGESAWAQVVLNVMPIKSPRHFPGKVLEVVHDLGSLWLRGFGIRQQDGRLALLCMFVCARVCGCLRFCVRDSHHHKSGLISILAQHSDSQIRSRHTYH